MLITKSTKGRRTQTRILMQTMQEILCEIRTLTKARRRRTTHYVTNMMVHINGKTIQTTGETRASPMMGTSLHLGQSKAQAGKRDKSTAQRVLPIIQAACRMYNFKIHPMRPMMNQCRILMLCKAKPWRSSCVTPGRLTSIQLPS